MKTKFERSWIAALAITLMTASAAYAQMPGNGGGGGRPPMGPPIAAVTTPVPTLTSALTLTSSQQSQIETIVQSFRDQMRSFMPPPDQNGGGGDGQGRPTPPDAATRSKIEALVSSSSDQITALLTPSQTTELTTLLGQLKELQAARISPHLYSQLNLTSDQFAQISKIEDATQATVKAAVQKAADTGDYDSVQQAIQDAHTQAHTQVIAILTPTQASLVENSGGQGGFGGQMGGPPNGGGQDSMGGGPPHDGGPGGGTGGPGGQGQGGPPAGNGNGQGF
jgi:hypothetical protein